MRESNKMSVAEMWYAVESMKGDAIVAVADDGTAKLLLLLTKEQWKLQAIESYDDLTETTFDNTPPGIYYATMSVEGCSVGLNHHHPDCPGDCFEVVWELSSALYLLPHTNHMIVTITRYDFNNNVFDAEVDGKHVIFDPFSAGGIAMTDDEYYNQKIAPTMVGHKFIVQGLRPRKGNIFYTTWKRPK